MTSVAAGLSENLGETRSEKRVSNPRTQKTKMRKPHRVEPECKPGRRTPVDCLETLDELPVTAGKNSQPPVENKHLHSQSFSSLQSANSATRKKAVVSRPKSAVASISRNDFKKSTAGSRSVKRESVDSLSNQFSRINLSCPNNPRQRIDTIDDIARLIQQNKVKRVVAMVGAGISTPSGIPDFRTPGTGLYDNLQQYKIPFAEAIFDIDYFCENPRPFCTLAQELFPTGKYQPNIVHYFLRLLHCKGLLSRVYTQNIDGLERLCGLPVDKLVEAHGSFFSASCVECHRKQPIEQVKDTLFDGKVPMCSKSDCEGFVKPDIVFFGEDLPKQFYQYTRDVVGADLLLVMGTSLKVYPFADIVNAVHFNVPRVLFNLNPVGPFRVAKRRPNDVLVCGDIVDKVRHFVQILGWSDDLDKLLPIASGPSSAEDAGDQLVPSPDQTSKENSNGGDVIPDNDLRQSSSKPVAVVVAGVSSASVIVTDKRRPISDLSSGAGRRTVLSSTGFGVERTSSKSVHQARKVNGLRLPPLNSRSVVDRHRRRQSSGSSSSSTSSSSEDD